MTSSARRWDSAETASFIQLAALDASLDLLVKVGTAAIAKHNDSLISEIIERLPRDRCVLASPAERERRGPYVSVSARKPEKNRELYREIARSANHREPSRECVANFLPPLQYFRARRSLDQSAVDVIAETLLAHEFTKASCRSHGRRRRRLLFRRDAGASGHRRHFDCAACARGSDSPRRAASRHHVVSRARSTSTRPPTRPPWRTPILSFWREDDG